MQRIDTDQELTWSQETDIKLCIFIKKNLLQNAKDQ